MADVTVVGTGYVGLVTGACLARMGHDVVCLDIDDVKITSLNEGHVPIYEPGLEDTVKQAISGGKLRFTSDIQSATEHGTFQFIAVGTPPMPDGSADTRFVLEAARNIGRYAAKDVIVIDKSTVPVGTADKVASAVSNELESRHSQLLFRVVSNPEFLKEGAAVDDFFHPDRIVVGTEDEVAMRAIEQLYAPLIENGAQVIQTSPRSAELIKYAANAMLATRISFMNELSGIAEAVGADIEDVRAGIGTDSRIGPSFLRAGAGYGGSCFPKDVQALAHIARADAGIEPTLLAAVEAVNTNQKHVLTRKLVQALGSLKAKKIAIWGLAFKPETDDMREASSLTLIKDLINAGSIVQAYDPIARETAHAAAPELEFSITENAFEAADQADALVIVTEWAEFASPDFTQLSKSMRGRIIIDGRNHLNATDVVEAGFTYHSIGRPSRG